MKICSICHKISASGEDHLDCVQKRRTELEDEDFKRKLTENLDITKNPNDIGIEIRAVLEHITKNKEE